MFTIAATMIMDPLRRPLTLIGLSRVSEVLPTSYDQPINAARKPAFNVREMGFAIRHSCPLLVARAGNLFRVTLNQIRKNIIKLDSPIFRNVARSTNTNP